MAVVLADGTYQVQRRPHPFTRDSHGTPVPTALGAAGTARAGAARRQAGDVWSLRLDPAEWPLYDGDKILGPDGRVWTVIETPRRHRHPVSDDVDYVAVAATLDPPEVP